MNPLYFLIIPILIILIFKSPFIGIVLTVSSLPIIDLLPPIPGFTSVISLIGGITLTIFIIKSIKNRERVIINEPLLILGFLYLTIIFISNPEAAWFGVSRNWIFTYIQLLLISWLSAVLLDTKEKHIILMWIFSIVSIISAYYSIQQGYIGETVDLSIRSEGFSEGANSGARYFAIGMVFLYYLRNTSTSKLARFFATIGVVITFIGVFFTGSRSGIILVFFAFGLMVIQQPQRKSKIQLIALYILSMVVLLILSDNILTYLSAIWPTISQGEGTMGVRYALWTAAWRMWLDYPILGVGIGVYPSLLIHYSQGLNISALHLIQGLQTHNMYIQVLVENGIAGFVLFISMLGRSLFNFFHIKGLSSEEFSLRNTWIVVFLLILFGGITKSDQADKFLWVVMGISIYFSRIDPRSKPDKNMRELSRN